MDPNVVRALRLGWSVAELRGRYREQLEQSCGVSITRMLGHVEG